MAPVVWRQGRKVGNHVYRQEGPEPVDGDEWIGSFPRPESAALAVRAVNAMLDPLEGAPLGAVPAELFNERGKWKYSVKLDYSGITLAPSGSTYQDPHHVARSALMAATRAGTSGVSMEEIPAGWTLFVAAPPNGWPIMAKGDGS